ncbi:MAG: hemolysin family protein [Endomicrobia bacterium]|nr:hemolysin family protein [Endomicrobiia bacterium]MCL2506910.1 hemolysin family protein [Endomicrobiia bacterium]
MLNFLELIALVFLVIIAAWTSAAEIGITSLSKYRVKKLIAQVPKLSASLSSWLKSPYYLLTVLLTVSVITDMLISFLSTLVMTDVFSMVNRHVMEAVAWVMTSFVLLVIGEIVPKFYARANSEKMTIFSVPILDKFAKILKPFLYPVIKITEFISPKTSPNLSNELSKEEIEGLLSEGGQAGAIDKETDSMLKRTMGFGDLSVKRIMTRFEDIDSVDLSLEEETFFDKAVETSRSRIPVYIKNKENIIGYVHIKDILWSWKENKGQFVRSLLKPPYYVSEDKKIKDLLKEFQSGKTHIAFVKDRNDNITGMVTLEDILEEVVGEIIDEYEYNG